MIPAGPLHDLTPEAAAARRDLMIRILKGETFPRPALPQIQRAREPRPSRARAPRAPQVKLQKAPRPVPTPEEQAARRKASIERAHAVQQGRRRAEAEAFRFAVPVGAWMTYRTRGGELRTAQVVGHVRGGEPLALTGRLKGGKPAKACHYPRYVVGIPSVEALAEVFHLAPPAKELERGLVEVHPGRPSSTVERLPEPIEPGSRVNWESRGCDSTVLRTGEVIGYIPAGTSARSMGLAFGYGREQTRRDLRDGIADVSIRDRYAVRVHNARAKRNTSGGLVYPCAYLLERQILNQKTMEKAS